MMVGKSDLPLEEAIKIARKGSQKTRVIHLHHKTKDALKRQYIQSGLSPEIQKLCLTKDVVIIITNY